MVEPKAIQTEDITDLSVHTAMTPRQARYFLEVLQDWQRNLHANDTEIAQVRQSALDCSAAGIHPLTALINMYSLMQQLAKGN